MGEPKREPLGAGAARAAPTAPHATGVSETAAKRKRSGPERFWARGPVRVAFVLCLVFSGALHYAVVPFELPNGFQMNDVEGEAAIPVDLLAPEAPPSQEVPSETVPPQAKTEDVKPKDVVPAASRVVDAGMARDAGTVRDAGPEDASTDGAVRDGVAGGANGSIGSDAALALADGGSGSGPRDPEAIVGAAGAIQADVVLVMLVVNAEVIRQHPVGARMGYLLRGVPQWDEFMSGTDIDPVRDADWVLISGPSLINTARDVILIRYSAPDAVIDRAVRVVSGKYDRGGAFDAGVPSVKAYMAHADRAERVILRPQPHVLAVVPPSVAQKVARQLAGSRVPPHVRPGEAIYMRLVNPHHPMPEIPESVTEMRTRVVPRPDLGTDVFVEGDTKNAETAAQAAEELRHVVRRHDDAFTSMLTHGLLDQVEVSSEGSLVKIRMVVTLDQIETLASLVGAFLGVQPDVPGMPPASASPGVPPAKRR